ncbi:hypothetical protein [Bacillus sp. BPN334]|uniref:hypothetical protein n=1 Tax=Bacillus sp. BPN334 TaxID=2217815 RepID=UPI0011ECFEDC|nr:hypothetical protein [Bacillus sp. BPN334]KAA0788695.1 hypothetical protein DN393_13815 [Bacillus sp. BPN334]
MPIITDRLKMSLPLGNEFVSREVLVQAFLDIDRLIMLSGNLDELKKAVNKYTDDAIKLLKQNTEDKIGKPNGIATLDGSGKVPTTQLPKRNAADINLSDSKNYYTEDTVEAALQQIGDILKNLQLKVSVYRSNKTANGIFATVEWKTKTGVLARKAVLSDSDTNGSYRKQTITFYAENGSTVIGTDVYVITYDADGDVTSEVLQ